MKNILASMKQHAGKVTAATGALVLSGAANATVEESLNAAITSGQTNYSTVVIGLIGLAAIGFDLHAIIKAMG
ncbi:hypothetical protein [Vibrio furnissii]|uniref:hypothetical protein n=1 Tax=Vibrio furnissii TaxID=29494 RepID=UPI001EEAFADD|nr:hypothetical protein [Vibrio furnissii]MCG6268010.1 hypothetical protein [Vibrio furnissii]